MLAGDNYEHVGAQSKEIEEADTKLIAKVPLNSQHETRKRETCRETSVDREGKSETCRESNRSINEFGRDKYAKKLQTL
jgi:hypothetical protein